ncbi:MAG: response regulator [Gemmatimonadetes bacterium]|nr:response regulator [Gemmatimonadota bacterium]
MLRASTRSLVLPALLYLVAYLAIGVFTLQPEWFGVDLALQRVVWLGSGVSLAAVLSLGPRIWPVLFAAELLVTTITGGSLLHGLGTGTANTAEAVIAGLLLRRVGVDGSLQSGLDIAALVVLAAGLAGGVAAALSTLSLVAFEGVPWERYGGIQILWWLTHANGMILIAPLILALRESRAWTVPRVVEAMVAMASVAVLGFLIFWAYDPATPGRRLLYAPFPLLIWAGIRFGIPGAATANLILSVVAMGATALDTGPFASPTLGVNERLFQLWLFVAINAITALVVAGVVEDRKRGARALVRIQDRLRSVLEATADAIVAADTEGNVSFANRRFAALWDPSGSEAPPMRLTHDDPRVAALLELTDQQLPELLESEQEILDEVELDDGRTFERFAAPLRRKDWISGRIWALRDLTERRRLEEQVQQNRRLESLGLLAGGIAHDFNNLLVAIMGNADLAEAALEGRHPARDHVDEVLRASQRAADLCQQMLAYAGKGRSAVEPVDLNDVVQEMTELMEVSLPPTAELTLRLSPDLKAVNGDVVQLRQVVLNLLTNAADAVGRRRGWIEVATFEATGNPVREQDAVVDERSGLGPWVGVRVADTGVGMDEETRQRIFDPFFSTKARGRGLGLAAVLGIVRGHQGALTLRTTAGRGSEIQVLLPALPAHMRPAAAPLLDLGRIGTLEGTVLVVDDEDTVREVAETMLEAMGLQVVGARDGVEALEHFDEDPDAIDLVLMDLTMPRMGGVAAAQALRERRPDLPILLSTGYLDAAGPLADRAELPLLKKPYRRDQLYHRVIELLPERAVEVAEGPSGE